MADKLGLLVTVRQKMDELNNDQMYDYVQSMFHLLSVEQLKNVLFVGLNHIKSNLQYNQLLQMKSLINELTENAKKLQEKSKLKTNTNKLTIPIVPKNASLTQVITFDIISNCICNFLKMSSISNLARCDRKLAIICHTPTSINNLMHRYDIYQYCNTDGVVDGYYYDMENWNLEMVHR
eukprot:124154_1